MLKSLRWFATPRGQRGVTLIEMIAFIVIAGIAMVVLVQVFAVSTRGSHTGKQLTQGVHLAQQRMEVIRGQRVRLGYAGFDANTFDPCDSVPGTGWSIQACQTTAYPAGSYQVTSTFNGATDACGAGTGTNCRVVTVTVTDPDGATVSVLTTQFWNY